MDTNPMWGGRFESGPSALMQRLNASIGIDNRLWQEDLAGSRAHAAMLGAQGIIPQADAEAILEGLDRLEAEFAANGPPSDPALEDIHMAIEARLAELIGPAAGRLHTARSRNDQVATAFRLWTRASIDRIDAALAALQSALLARAAEHAETIMPGFTHLQVAQPVTLGHHLMAYHAMLDRDRGRMRDARTRLNECPLGAAALAGTSFPIDRHATASALGFARPTPNSLDSVSDRDFALEFLSAAAITGLHLSRLAEEVILWASQPFGFVTLPDAWSTGSSIMPQKRNPDAAELTRAKAARLTAHFAALAGIMKALPLAYAKDLQEDKALVFEAADTLELLLAAAAGTVETLAFHPDRMRAAAAQGHATATDLADWIVQQLGLPFREAHQLAGRAVRAAEARQAPLTSLNDSALAEIDPRLADAPVARFTVEHSVASRTSHGGTAPVRVREMIAAAGARA